MGDAQNPIWMFLKNFSNKFSISDHVNGNNSSTSRKYYSYDRLETHDKGDFLSSSNPHLLDIVGNGLEKSDSEKEDDDIIPSSKQAQKEPKLKESAKVPKNGEVTSPTTTPSTLPFLERIFLGNNGNSSNGGNNSSTLKNPGTTETTTKGGTEGHGMLMSKKFTFSARVTNYQDDNGGNDEHRNEDSDDSNWIDEDEDEDRHEYGDSSDFDDDENTNKCGYCGCEEKYTITKFVD